jgi:hypothetical protein
MQQRANTVCSCWRTAGQHLSNSSLVFALGAVLLKGMCISSRQTDFCVDDFDTYSGLYSEPDRETRPSQRLCIT